MRFSQGETNSGLDAHMAGFRSSKTRGQSLVHYSENTTGDLFGDLILFHAAYLLWFELMMLSFALFNQAANV